jgi:hypothetical protein
MCSADNLGLRESVIAKEEHAMRAEIVRASLAACVALGVAVPTYAKAPLQRVMISGGGLAEPITVADQETLALSNPWHGSSPTGPPM